MPDTNQIPGKEKAAQEFLGNPKNIVKSTQGFSETPKESAKRIFIAGWEAARYHQSPVDAGSDINSYWLKKLVKKDHEIKELKKDFCTALRVLKIMCEKAGLELGSKKATELINELEKPTDIKKNLRDYKTKE